MNIGYCRVSTKDQSVDRQIDRLKAAGCAKTFVDKRSGKNTDRPELQRMLEQLRADNPKALFPNCPMRRSAHRVADPNT